MQIIQIRVMSARQDLDHEWEVRPVLRVLITFPGVAVAGFRAHRFLEAVAFFRWAYCKPALEDPPPPPALRRKPTRNCCWRAKSSAHHRPRRWNL